MRKLIQFSGYSLFYFAFLFLFASCNSGTQGDGTAGDTIIDSSNAQSDTGQASVSSISGTYDNLWIEKTVFDQLEKSILVFSFAFRTKDTLTLYGWSCRGSSGKCKFDSTNIPNIKLLKGKPSSVRYGPEVVFGNILLTQKAVKDLQGIPTSYKYLVFIPEYHLQSLRYRIIATNENPALIKDFTSILDSEIFANPSPPKGYDEPTN